MKYKQLALASLALSSPGWVLADSVDERLSRMEAEMAAMQRKIEAQETTIRQQADTLAEQETLRTEGAPQRVEKLEEDLGEKLTAEDKEGAWYEKIKVGGVVEVEAYYTSPYVGDSESDVVLSTFELGVESQVTDWVNVGASLLYEEDDTDLEVDVAYATLANADVTPVFVTAGQIYVPFGAYETALISDPLTLEIGETRETALQLGFDRNGLIGSVYVFNGDNEKDGKNRISSWGVNLNYTHALENGDVAAGIGYLSDLGDSDSLQDVINDNQGDNDTDFTGGWTLNVVGHFGSFSLIGEYLAAAEDFSATAVPWKQGGAKPSAWNLEADYAFRMFDKDATVAFAYQGTDEALALELPKQRFLIGLSTEIFKNTSLSFEWAHDEDYDASDGGTGKSADSVVAQLAVEF
ncbi:MAG: LbtU family siderophore porin [Gammaproteobacteria bacterium]|nr:LbtU family siderophore porin [Gammaproteobacteria bacterium]MCP5425758.1 LbtU family siderophore porin [Gammaproteobacteria bacterium]MCP5458631.1 LbtU family siderophore porin [Gammaproteobacteria bacterium]